MGSEPSRPGIFDYRVAIPLTTGMELFRRAELVIQTVDGPYGTTLSARLELDGTYVPMQMHYSFSRQREHKAQVRADLKPLLDRAK